MKYLISLGAIALLTGCASHPQTQTYTYSMPVNQPGWPAGATLVSTNPVVYVRGEVKCPDRIEWHPGLTVSNAIAKAGGLTDFSNARWMDLTRVHCDGTNYLMTKYQIAGPETNMMVLEQDDQLRVKRSMF